MISQFTLGAVNWKVKVDNPRLNDLNLWGLCESGKSLISLVDSGLDKGLVQQTFYHELVHAILNTMNELELSNNEKFVQQFGVLLHQFETTKKNKNK